MKKINITVSLKILCRRFRSLILCCLVFLRRPRPVLLRASWLPLLSRDPRCCPVLVLTQVVTAVVVTLVVASTQRLTPSLTILERISPTLPSSGGVFYPEKKGKGQKVNKKLDLIVIRVNSDDELCISRPCYNCLSMMKAVNIRRVYYVDNKGDIVSENVRDMISIHASSVTRYIHSIKDGETYMGRESIFFKKLLKTLFPATVKRTNFDSFVRHDLSVVLPDHTYIIKTDGATNVVIILDSSKEEVLKSTIVN